MGVRGIEELKGETGTEDQPDPQVPEQPVPAPDTEPPIPDGDDQEAGQGVDVPVVDEDDLADVQPEDER